MATNTELRVFISSTFRDLQEEREHLVKKIFPEIRALCRQRGIRFTEVDLRWGLTDEDLALGQVITTCLAEVDKCRPYFIGITGDRYGYVPTFVEIQKDPALLEQYPWIEDAASDGMSITEMEAQYAVLNASLKSIESIPSIDAARFYFRRHREDFETDSTDPERALLEAYQQRIRRSGLPVELFRDPVSLGELIRDDLVKIIKRDFADARPPTPLEEERMRHEAFSLSRRRAYIANPAYLKRLNDHATGDGPPLVVYAESGSGKSSLFAYWAEQYKRKNPNAHVVEHYVGIGATATDYHAVIRHFCMEVKERFGREEDIPTQPKALELAMGQWIGYADFELTKRGEKLILILDGLNQLSGAALRLQWIPDVISPSIRLIISSTVEGTLMELRGRGWTQFGMQALREDEREAIVVRYLAEYRKSLNAGQIKRISGDYKCGHPLFLKTLLEELRLVGRHEDLERRIDEYLEATGTEDLFQRMLERMEEDHGARAMRDVMTMLWLSRFGLSERELADITGISRLKVATMIAGLEYHLVKKEGRLTFFHDYLRRAVEKRYLAEARMRKERSAQLAAYFEKAEITIRSTLELLHALESLGDRARLEKAATDIERFTQLWPGAERHDVLRVWSDTESAVVAKAYRSSLEEWVRRESPEPARHTVVLACVGYFFETIGAWTEAESVQRDRLALARESGNRAGESRTLSGLAWLATRMGRQDESEQLAREAERIARETGDRESIAGAVGNRGNVHFDRGEHDAALACYAEQESIARELGNRRTIAIAVGNRGNVHLNRGEYDAALACYAEQESIARGMGDRDRIGVAVGNRGIVHKERGECDAALACYAEAESIARAMGERRSAAITVGNRGGVHHQRGEYDAALACFEDSLAVHRELGFRYGVTYWLAGSSRALLELAERERDPPSYITRFVPEAVGAAWKEACRAVARSRAEECLVISRELHKPDTLHQSQVLLARIDAAEGSTDTAMEHLRTMLTEAGRDDDRADLHYWMWKLAADRPAASEHAASALALYEALCANTPKYEYKKRLEECKIVD